MSLPCPYMPHFRPRCLLCCHDPCNMVSVGASTACPDVARVSWCKAVALALGRGRSCAASSDRSLAPSPRRHQCCVHTPSRHAFTDWCLGGGRRGWPLWPWPLLRHLLRLPWSLRFSKTSHVWSVALHWPSTHDASSKHRAPGEDASSDEGRPLRACAVPAPA